MKTFRWKVKPDMEVNSQPSVREVRFGDGYSQRMAAGLNADLKTYRVTLSVTGRRPGIWKRSWQSTEAGRHFCGSHPMHTGR
ncbi:hypothetical protein CFSAN004177_26600 [Escherichia coli]|nr:hypothetical protein CFSAN004177_26600 [Escherichia coli]